MEIKRRLSKQDLNKYESKISETLNDLGSLYRVTGQFNQSLDCYTEALEIIRKLVKINATAYEPFLATTLSNLANLYSQHDLDIDAEPLYLEALEIKERLAKANPKEYETEIAMTQQGLCVCYRKLRKYEKTEESCHKALTIFKNLSIRNPGVFDSQVAMASYNYGIYYIEINDFVKGESFLDESFKLCKQLNDKFPHFFNNNLSLISEAIVKLYEKILILEGFDNFLKHWKFNFDSIENLLFDQAKTDSFVSKNLIDFYRELSNDFLFTSKFKEAELIAKKGLVLKPDYCPFQTILGHSLLFQNKYYESVIIYQQLKQNKGKHNKICIKICLQDLDEFERNGITNKYVIKIRSLLKE